MPGVLHDIAQRAIQVHGALGVSATRCRSHGMLLRRQRHGPGRRADRGAQGHRRPPGAARLQAERRPLADPAPARSGWPRPARSSPSTSSTKWGTCDRHRPRSPPGWTTQGLPGKGEPLEHGFISGGSQNEIYEIRRGDLHGALRIPPPTAPESRDDGILREWRIIEALDGTDVPHTAGHRRLHRPVGARPHLLPHGLRRRLVADGPRDEADGSRPGPSRSTPTSTPGGASPSSWSRASRCSPRSTGRPRASRTSAGPTASTSARSTAGPRSSSASRAASSRASTRRPRGCAPTSRSTSSPASCTATTSSPT